MSTPVKPFPDYIFVIPNTAETTTKSGILLPETAKEEPKTAKVVAVGSNVVTVKVGENVIYKDSYDAGNVEFPINKEKHVLVHIKNVVGTVE